MPVEQDLEMKFKSYIYVLVEFLFSESPWLDKKKSWFF